MTPKGQPAAITPTAKGDARITGTKAVVLYGALAFLLCGIFPPWLYTVNDSNVRKEESAGFRFILNAPDPGDIGVYFGTRMDTARLGVEWLCVLAATGAAWVLVAKPRRLAQISTESCL